MKITYNQLKKILTESNPDIQHIIEKEISDIVENKLHVLVQDVTFSYDPDTDTGTIHFNGYGKAYGDGYDYSAEASLEFQGVSWKIKSYYVNENNKFRSHDFTVKEVTPEICTGVSYVMLKHNQKFPKFMKISYYASYD